METLLELFFLSASALHVSDTTLSLYTNQTGTLVALATLYSVNELVSSSNN